MAELDEYEERAMLMLADLAAADAVPESVKLMAEAALRDAPRLLGHHPLLDEILRRQEKN